MILTTFERDEYVLSALRAGANGFLGKGSNARQLTEGILDAASGGHALSNAAKGTLIDNAVEQIKDAGDPEAKRLFATLTTRELEVVELVVQGLDNAAIGQAIHVSPFTVKTHVSRAMQKTGSRDRAHLVTLAVRAGIKP